MHIKLVLRIYIPLLQIIVAPQRRKLLQMYALTGDKLIHLKDFPIAEQALDLARDDESVCAALAPGGSGEGRYMVLNIAEGKVNVCPFQLHSNTHIIFLDNRPARL